MFGSDTDEEELVGGAQETRNWGGIIISLLVILLICSLIIITALIVSPRVVLSTKYEFDDMFNATFIGKTFEAQWINDNEFVRLDDSRNINLYNLNALHQPQELVNRRIWDDHSVSKFEVSHDKKYVLLACRRKSLYRFSYYSIYKIYDVTQGVIIDSLSPPDVADSNEEVYLRYAGWAPKSSGLIFVYKNDIYFKSSVSIEGSIRLTSTGRKDTIFNGVPDWVYEEDVVRSDHAIYWHGHGNKFVFGSFDDTEVQSSWIPVYNHEPYPTLTHIKYPLPSYPIPSVKLYVVDVSSPNTPTNVTVIPPESVLHKKEYIYRYVVWINPLEFAVTWLNRAQNFSVISICNASSGYCDEVPHEEHVHNGWVVLRGPPVFSKSGDKFATILPRSIDKDEFYYHAFVLHKQRSKNKYSYTMGRFEVAKIVAFKGEDTLYVLSNQNASWNRHLYRIEPGEKSFDTTCLSCDVHPNCTYFDAQFLPNSDKYILFCEGFGVPRVTLHTIGQDGTIVLEENEKMAQAVYNREYIEQRFEVIEMNGREIPVRLLESNMMDLNRDHPFLLSVYGGPESQSVTSEFYQGWFTYLASMHHFVIAEIDGRGTANLGQRNMMDVYKRLGQYEVDDQVDIIRYLRNTNASDERAFNRTRIDKDKVAVFGWSYGGFLSTMVHAKSDVFNCSVAVAPVTDWRYYSALYTERYMGFPTPTENIKGYEAANVSSYAKDVKGNSSLLLVHGMADTNVHFQNTANLVGALLKANVDHKTIFYPTENHFMGGEHTQRNLYKMMTDFLIECLHIVPLEE